MLAKKIKKSRANNLRSLKKEEEKEERRTYTNEDATRVVLFLTSLDATKAAKRAFIISTVFEPKLSSTTLES